MHHALDLAMRYVVGHNWGHTDLCAVHHIHGACYGSATHELPGPVEEAEHLPAALLLYSDKPEGRLSKPGARQLSKCRASTGQSLEQIDLPQHFGASSPPKISM